MGLTKSKSKSETYNESAVKNSITGENININSKKGSVILKGTDIKTEKDLNLIAKENIDIKAEEEKNKSSNSSSSSGISTSISLNETPLSATISTSGNKGRANGTSYVNSIINVGGNLKTESEKLTISGANIEANKIDVKANDILVESKQDISESKDSSYGTNISLTINPAMPIKDFNLNRSKGKGEGEWVNNQTTLIARNGGEIEAGNKLTNTGAVIGSLNKEEKLKVAAKQIEVNNLEDKNKYENKGGGISTSIGTTPNISVVHDKVDKEQINRATAINTEFTINNEEKTAEDLGFNTNLEKAQEVTKDKEKHLNAELHTDLLDKEERDKIVLAGRKVGTVIEALTEDKGVDKLETYKVGLRAIHIDELRKEREKEFAFVDDENTSPLDKLRALRDLQAELYITDEPNSFAVDGKNGETRKIFISLNDLKRGNSSALLYAHENVHLIQSDKDEKIAKYAETKIGETKNKFTESEKEEYLSNLRKNVEIDKSLEEQFTLAKNIPSEDRENYSTPEEREFRKNQQNIIYFTDERLSQIKDGTIDMTVGSGTVIGGVAIIGSSIGVDTVSFGTTLIPSTGAKVIGTTGVIVGSNKLISGVSQIFNGVYGREVKKGLNPIKDTLIYVNPSGEYRDFYNALEVVTEVGVGQLSPYAIGVNRNDKNQKLNYAISIEKKADNGKKSKDLYHNTPILFDEYMLENGTIKDRGDGRIEFMMKGYMNGKEGVFHTTLKSGDTVIHKNFISAEKWDNYIKNKELPKYNEIK